MVLSTIEFKINMIVQDKSTLRVTLYQTVCYGSNHLANSQLMQT